MATRVLLVDDSHDICALVRFKLEGAGYVVAVEHDGEAGLAAARADQPDLLLLDWMMPRLSGLQVCVELRSVPDFATTAIILLTSRAQKADVERGFAAGADDYVIKPFSPKELLCRVQRALERSTP